MKKVITAVAASLFVLAGAAQAQDYPNKPITVIVPFSAGGPTDTVARLVGQSMGNHLKQQVIIENVGGAGGTLGAGRVARSAPDGYTLLLHHIGQATSATLYRKLPYDSVNDFTPVGLVTDVPMTIVAKKDLPAKDIKELIAYVKQQGDKVSYGNAGIGAASHLCGMMFMSALDTKMTTVAYRGTGPAMQDLLGGQIDLMCDQTTNTTGQIKSGAIKAYAVTTKTRVPSLPELPTMQESGIANFEVGIWHGLYGPKGMSDAIAQKLSEALKVALKDPAVVTRFRELGTEPVADNLATPAALGAHLKAEIAKWAPVIKAAGEYAD